MLNIFHPCIWYISTALTMIKNTLKHPYYINNSSTTSLKKIWDVLNLPFLYFFVVFRFHKLWSQEFAAALWKKLSNESHVIINSSNLNMLKKLVFLIIFYFSYVPLPINLWIRMFGAIAYGFPIYIYKKNENVFNLRKNIISRNKQNIDFITWFHHIDFKLGYWVK